MLNNMENEKLTSTGYQSAIGVAVVALVFSVFIAIMLGVTVCHVKVTDPARAIELEELKLQAKDNPTDTALAERVLALDTPLRRDQFARQYFLKRGTVLLVVTLGLFAAGWLWASSHKPIQPTVTPQGDVKVQQVIGAQRTRTAISIVLVLFCGGALFYSLRTPQLPVKSDSEEPVSLYASIEDAQSQWSTFRGPGGLGVCTFENIPDTWDGKSGQNILWKTPIDLPGHNSPVLWNDRIFVTGATEDAQAVYCVDAATGVLLWKSDVTLGGGAARDDMQIMKDTGHAACTAVTDGKRVCAIFAGGDIACFSLDGNKLWEKNLGIPDSMYGYSASLTWYENLVIIQWDVGYDDGEDSLSKLIALDWQTGNQAWQTHRPLPSSWGSPTVAKVGDVYQILTTGYPYLIAYEPTAGTEIFRVACTEGDIAATPIVADSKVVFTIEPYNKLVAIDPLNAQGDVTETNILWENDSEMPDICSPVANSQYVWTLTTMGDLGCFSVADGSEVYTEWLDANFQASPTLVGDVLYILSEKGEMILAEAGAEYKEIKRNALGEKTFASPAFQNGRIYIRGHKHLYGIGAGQ
ncbi:MAG: outer membrane protein assembly factor BamB family protein [Planctomycetota bacterium]|jgi:outer membrane protein assembly factor BamB